MDNATRRYAAEQLKKWQDKLDPYVGDEVVLVDERKTTLAVRMYGTLHRHRRTNAYTVRKGRSRWIPIEDGTPLAIDASNGQPVITLLHRSAIRAAADAVLKRLDAVKK